MLIVMSTWIRKPDSGAASARGRRAATDRLVARRWHLEGLLPRTDEVVFAACGRSWTLSTTELIEHAEDLAAVPEFVRCEACTALYADRITMP
jgi:hypothetical protein